MNTKVIFAMMVVILMLSGCTTTVKNWCNITYVIGGDEFCTDTDAFPTCPTDWKPGRCK